MTTQDSVIDPTLPCCPFCGGPVTREPWHGGAPTKQMIMCAGDDCEVSPMVTGETPDEATANWSRRAC